MFGIICSPCSEFMNHKIIGLETWLLNANDQSYLNCWDCLFSRRCELFRVSHFFFFFCCGLNADPSASWSCTWDSIWTSSGVHTLKASIVGCICINQHWPTIVYFLFWLSNEVQYLLVLLDCYLKFAWSNRWYMNENSLISKPFSTSWKILWFFHACDYGNGCTCSSGTCAKSEMCSGF